jgi:sensor histidine kinase YesM
MGIKFNELKFFKSNNAPFIHSLIWLVYAFFIYVANKLTKSETNFIGIISFLLPFIITFYISVFVLNIYKNKPILWGIVSFFLVFIFMTSLGYIYVYFLLPSLGIKLSSSKNIYAFIQTSMLGYFQYFAYACLYYYLSDAFVKENKLRVLEKENLSIEKKQIKNELEISKLKQKQLNAQTEKLQLEYAFLRAQINPHFLHNTLNVLFSQALSYSPILAENILKLSKIMRYSIESLEYESGSVSIEKELEHLSTLIEIHKMRFGNEQIIKYSIEGDISGQTLPPLSIITIVENAFKYGDLTDPEHPLEILINLSLSEISFICLNKKRNSEFQLSSTSIGISNLSKRLDASFKNKYIMNVDNNEIYYKFELIIKQS